MLQKITSVLLATGLCLLSQLASAQASRPQPAPAAHWCGTEAVQERYFAGHPGARAAQQAFYQRLVAGASAQPRGTAAAADVTIPVVVHVIHAGGPDNISDAQISSAIDQLNLDYQKQNADTAGTIALFQPIAASVGFRFRLAKRDPNGQCTTGITRHYAPTLVVDDFSGAVQGLVSWDSNRYLNIWVVNAISVPGLGGTIGGYSPLPQTAPAQMDGLVVRQDYFGNTGTSSPANALRRVATHEIGHHFGLLHTWGATAVGTGSCTGDDNVADTPPTDGTMSCNTAYSPCGTVTNVQNYMDYSGCSTMFTQGQRALVRNVLQTIRTQLSTPANLLATGTNDGYVASACAPVAQFAPSQKVVCEGSAVTFYDFSYNAAPGTALTYSWSFPGGTPATSTSASPTVTYPTAGFYDATLTVANAAGNNSSTLRQLIQVSGASSGETAPLVDSFEPYTAFPNYYPAPTQRNYQTRFDSPSSSNPGNGWSRRVAASSSPIVPADGRAYLLVPNRSAGSASTATSVLITPNIDLRGLPTAVLSFSEYYGAATATANVALTVAFSNDCGLNWTDMATYSNAQLNLTGTSYQAAAYPAAVADWRSFQLPIAANWQGANFKVRFTATHDAAASDNPLYFDKLSITTGVLGTQAAGSQPAIQLYPNPLTTETAVHLSLPVSTRVQVRLLDVLGREVLATPARTYPAGAASVPLAPAGALRAGLYMVRVSLGPETFSTRLIVE